MKNDKDLISFLVNLIGCCAYGYMIHIQSGISNDLLSVNQSVKDFVLYLNNWNLVSVLILLMVYLWLKDQDQK